MKQQGASFIDAFSGLRGLAALGVFIYHFHHVGYFEPITSRLPYFFKNGWFLVDLFFILSGWVISHVYFSGLAKPTSDRVITYFGARIARLYPLHLVVLLTWLVVERLVWQRGPGPDLPARLLGQLTMSFTWGPLAQAGFVQPAWSISAEFANYLLFPLLAAAGWPNSRGRAFVLILVGASIYVMLNQLVGTIHVITQLAPVRAIAGFMIGMGLWRLAGERAPRSAARAAVAEALVVLALAAMAIARADPLLLVAGSSALILAIADGQGPVARLLSTPPAQKLGDLSFGLYLWHWFAIVALTRLDLRLSVPEAWLLMVATVVGILALSEASLRFIEFPLRALVQRQIRKIVAAQAISRS
jgi:peptidoglycan/LPS O-acetylase OafA/YrhL